MQQHVTHSISLRSMFAFFLVGILFYALYYLREIVLIVLSSIVIAAAAAPAVRALTARNMRRTFAAVVVYFTFVGFFVGVGYFFIPTLLNETSQLLQDLPRYASKEHAITLDAPVLGTLSSAELATKLQEAFTGITGDPLGALFSIFGGLFGCLLVFVFSFYFTMEEDGVEDFLSIATPASHEAYVLGLWHRVEDKIALWMQGQLLLGVIVAVLTFLLLTIFGVPHALVLAVIAGAFEVIPLFGPVLSAVPALGVAYAAGGAQLALIVSGIYLVVHQFENHLIYPLVVTKVVGVSPVLVILALTIGYTLAGFFGVLLAVPVATLIQELASDIDKQRHMR